MGQDGPSHLTVGCSLRVLYASNFSASSTRVPARRIAIGLLQLEPGPNSALQREDRRSHQTNCGRVLASLEARLPRRLDEQRRLQRGPASLGLEEGLALSSRPGWKGTLEWPVSSSEAPMPPCRGGWGGRYSPASAVLVSESATKQAQSKRFAGSEGPFGVAVGFGLRWMGAALWTTPLPALNNSLAGDSEPLPGSDAVPTLGARCTFQTPATWVGLSPLTDIGSGGDRTGAVRFSNWRESWQAGPVCGPGQQINRLSAAERCEDGPSGCPTGGRLTLPKQRSS